MESQPAFVTLDGVSHVYGGADGTLESLGTAGAMDGRAEVRLSDVEVGDALDGARRAGVWIGGRFVGQRDVYRRRPTVQVLHELGVQRGVGTEERLRLQEEHA